MSEIHLDITMKLNGVSNEEEARAIVAAFDALIGKTLALEAVEDVSLSGSYWADGKPVMHWMPANKRAAA